MFDRSKIDDYFPIRVNGQPSYREGQLSAIEFIVDSFNNGKRVVIIEGPVGSGKSAIGMTVASMVDYSYYLTTTKILQDQLTSEFADLVELKGRNAYPCDFHVREGQNMIKLGIWNKQNLNDLYNKKPSCAEGYCKTRSNAGSKSSGSVTGRPSHNCSRCFTKFDVNAPAKIPVGDLKELPEGKKYSACPYYDQVFRAIEAKQVTMNFSSFIYQTQMTKRFENPRNLMIVDECHNIEPQLMDFVSLSISDIILQNHGIVIPELSTAADYAIWFEEVKIHEVIFEALEAARDDNNYKLEDDLSRLLRKYKMFVDHVSDPKSEWVCEYEVMQSGFRKVTLKPVFIHGMVEPLLFRYADKILMMSATILDVNVICSSLGVDKSEVAAIRLKNRFPVENRPIYLKTVAKMTGGKNEMHVWGAKLVDGVNEIADRYKGKRGIIHTHNFAIQELLKNKCQPGVKSRFRLQQDFSDKKAMLEEHSRIPDSIIVAPAMHEGINLHGDLSRFQIICKVPYANCFDNAQLARRVELDRRYYTWLTALKLVQSYGRSIRSETDHADTFILDESIRKFISDAKNMLPIWFTEAIIDQKV